MTGVHIGDLYLEKPIIQGGMGIGVSRGLLAGTVAREGGMGVLSTAQIGYDAPLFGEIMSVTQLYGVYVKEAIKSGVDAIISGAGLPVNLPEYVKDAEVKIAPVVASKKAADIIMKLWDKKYQRAADFIIMESPYSGGHQGYRKEALKNLEQTALCFDEDVRKTVELKKQYEEKYGKKIPLFVAGGIFTCEDTLHAAALGADGVQVGTRFIATEECDAAEAYKREFVRATAENLVIIDSPVGMPARAIRNPFVERMLKESEEITFCYNCLKACNPQTAKYCISQALINAVKGDVEHGLIFSSAKVGQIKKIQTVSEVMKEVLP